MACCYWERCIDGQMFEIHFYSGLIIYDQEFSPEGYLEQYLYNYSSHVEISYDPLELAE